MINFRQHEEREADSIKGLFTSVFTQSQGQAEGILIGNLARDLIAHANKQDIYCFVAEKEDRIVGAIFFSRLTFAADVQAFILAPVAVDAQHQRKGIGQMLINHGLMVMRKNGAQLMITYGDPEFYSKVGFRPLPQNLIPAPLALSQPEGWLGQSLEGAAIAPISSPCSCVKALDNPVYW